VLEKERTPYGLGLWTTLPGINDGADEALPVVSVIEVMHAVNNLSAI
jgi:hypothetical protein